MIFSRLIPALAAALLAVGCGRTPESKIATAAPPAPVKKSGDCRACHEGIYQAWSGSHHALANRPVEPQADADAFGAAREFSAHGIDYRVEWKDGRPHFTEKRTDTSAIESYVAEFALGHTPIRQYVVPQGGGRFQAAELTFDPGKKEWFNVFGDERRRRGEWGHWTGRGMNWNSMCAHCHMTGYEKNYNATTDIYATTWREHGIGCTQCHGDLPATHFDPARKNLPGPSRQPHRH